MATFTGPQYDIIPVRANVIFKYFSTSAQSHITKHKPLKHWCYLQKCIFAWKSFS